MMTCVLNSSFGSHGSEARIHWPILMMVAKHTQHDCVLQ